MVTFYHTLCLVLQCYRTLKQDIFPSFFMVIHVRGQGSSLRTTLLHCKDDILAVAKRMESNKLLEILFALFLSVRLSLNVEFVHIKSLRYSACQMMT